MVIQLGYGRVEIAMVRGTNNANRIGVLLRQLDEEHAIGALTLTDGMPFTVEDESLDHVVIWLDKLESARVLQDALSLAVLTILDMQPPLPSVNKGENNASNA
jgi:hypothetical protein